MNGVHGRPSAIVHGLAEEESNTTTGQKSQLKAVVGLAITNSSKKNPAIPVVAQVTTMYSRIAHLLHISSLIANISTVICLHMYSFHFIKR